MTTHTEAAVQEVHRLAVQQSLTRILRTKEDWQRFNAIAQEAAERVDAERADFQSSYQDRLAEARQAILREQNDPAPEPPRPSWAGQAPPNHPTPDQLETQAQSRVQAEHTQYLAAIRREEVAAYRTLRTELQDREDRRAHAHSVRKDHARDAFNQANHQSPHEAQTRGRCGPSR
ncbi:MAG: hypothetical protein AAGF86_11370 [Pseudomonadota bacterium]